MKNYLSFGGGVNSVALYLLMEDLGIEFEAVFVDHGGDWPETYEYLKYFIETGRKVTILLPDIQGFSNIYEYYLHKKAIPSIMKRDYTDKFKITPFYKYVERPCFVLLGIDAGESHRARLNSKKGVENRYPLIEERINRDGCKTLILDHGLVVPPKSGCFFCMFQKKGQWIELRKKHPNLFCKAEQLENNCIKDRKSRKKAPFTISNNGRYLSEVIKQRRGLLPQFYEEYPPCQCETE